MFDYQEKNLIRSTTEKGIKKWLKRHPSTNLLFHHRFPTSTANVKNACHPFSTKDFFRTNYVLVHNGHISNYKALRAEHEKLGIVYHSVQPDGSFNDSEALLWDLALYLEGKQDSLKAEGGIAFVCMAIGKGNKHDRLYFGRNYNPLRMKLNEHILMLSSEGEGELIKPHTLYNYNYVNNQLTTQELDIDRWEYQGNYQTTSRDLTSVGDILEGYEVGEAPSTRHGVSLIKVLKTDPVIRSAEVTSIIDRALWRNEGWYYEVEQDLMFDYDSLTLLYYQWQKLGYNLIAVSYTMKLYEEASERLDEMQRVDEYQNPDYAWDSEPQTTLIEGETT